MIKKTRYRAGGKKRKHSDREDRVYIHYTVFPRKKQGRTPSEREFFAVFLRVLHVFLRFHLAEAFEIFVGIKAVGLQLDHRHGDVGAVVGDTLVVCEKVVKNKAHGERAGAVLQTDDVMELHLVAQSVDRILQRLDAPFPDRSR